MPGGGAPVAITITQGKNSPTTSTMTAGAGKTFLMHQPMILRGTVYSTGVHYYKNNS